ncbi:MAG: hypothetical protein WDO69_33440 [Pseudomonadota bacterium]
MAGSSVEHYLTYQHNVQAYFRAHATKYDGMIIPLSIITAFPSGTYGFVRALCTADQDKQYGIDPRSALFQKKWNRNNVREPHRKMAEVFGEPFVSKGLTSHLEPSDFPRNVAEAVTRACLDYQKTFRQRPEDAKKLEKYRKLLGVEHLEPLRAPQFLVPPYFQFEDLSDPWWKVSIACIEAAIPHTEGLPLRPVLHFQRWNSVDWTKAFGKLKKLGLPASWLYANNFREHVEPQEQLNSLVSAVSLAAAANLPVYNLFGGYFSILTGRLGLKGFGNGVGYGEWRDSGYHKGGTADRRIYILKLHRFLDIPRAQNLVDADPEYFGRDTELLGACVDEKRPLDELTIEECLEHFMDCRATERTFAASATATELLDELTGTQAHLAAIGDLELKEYGSSLERWRKALEPSLT